MINIYNLNLFFKMYNINLYLFENLNNSVMKLVLNLFIKIGISLIISIYKFFKLTTNL